MRAAVALCLLALMVVSAAAIPKSCHSTENWEYSGVKGKIKTVYDLPGDGDLPTRCCDLCKATPTCKKWDYAGSRFGYGCSLYKNSASKKKWGGCSRPNSCTHRSGYV